MGYGVSAERMWSRAELCGEMSLVSRCRCLSGGKSGQETPLYNAEDEGDAEMECRSGTLVSKVER